MSDNVCTFETLEILDPEVIGSYSVEVVGGRKIPFFTLRFKGVFDLITKGFLCQILSFHVEARLASLTLQDEVLDVIVIIIGIYLIHSKTIDIPVLKPIIVSINIETHLLSCC